MNAKQMAAIAAAGMVGLSACSSTSSSSSDSSTTTTAAPSSTTSTTAAPSSTTSTTATSSSTTGASGTAGTLPAAPAGAQTLQTANQNGANYARYQISGQTPSQVVSGYQTELTNEGYSVSNQGGGGGGWGKWGGAGAGLTANKGSNYVAVQAGGQSSGPTYFEVCAGPSEQSVNDCENASQGPQSNTGGS